MCEIKTSLLNMVLKDIITPIILLTPKTVLNKSIFKLEELFKFV